MKIHPISNKSVVFFALGLCPLALLWLSLGCEEDTSTGPHHSVETPVGTLVSASDCKQTNTVSNAPGAGTVPVFDCIEYEYNSDGALLLKHVNAAFNCCPGEITADVTISGDTIMIVEHEGGSPPCHCLCLYDLDYRIDNLDPGTYRIIVRELYTTESDAPLETTFDFASNPSDSFCVPRDHYPWDTDGGSTGPSGKLVSRTGCKSGFAPASGAWAPPDMTCVEYVYLSGGILMITHENAGFNCCPGEITADIKISNNTITIVEHEAQNACDCSCLYDLTFEITNLEPGQYVLKIVELYLQPGDERLEFTIDLAGAPSCAHCADRNHYPWTHQDSQTEDWARLVRMGKGIIDFIGKPLCAGDGDCRYIAFGSKPCGGPWRYLTYSAATVDPVALAGKVCLYNAMNDVYNRRHNIASDCSIPTPPDLGCVAGMCADLNVTRR